jgi:hypothetical protein
MKTSTRRRSLKDALMSFGAVLLLALILIAMDGRVREQVALRFETHDAASLAQTSTKVRDLADVVLDVVRDRTSSERTLMVFVVAATVLVVFMVRT